MIPTFGTLVRVRIVKFFVSGTSAKHSFPSTLVDVLRSTLVLAYACSLSTYSIPVAPSSIVRTVALSTVNLSINIFVRARAPARSPLARRASVRSVRSPHDGRSIASRRSRRSRASSRAAARGADRSRVVRRARRRLGDARARVPTSTTRARRHGAIAVVIYRSPRASNNGLAASRMRMRERALPIYRDVFGHAGMIDTVRLMFHISRRGTSRVARRDDAADDATIATIAARFRDRAEPDGLERAPPSGSTARRLDVARVDLNRRGEI